MSESDGQGQGGSALRVEDIERALVLAREVAAATAKGDAANLRVEHLRTLFATGPGRPGAERMQAALEAAGLTVDPPLAERPESVSLRVDRGRAALAPAAKPARDKPGRSASTPDDEPPPRLAGVAAYAAAAGMGRRRAARPSATAPDAVTLADAQQKVAADQADMRTPESIAALMPALIVPVLAASFLGPLFGAIFAGLALLTSTLLSRPGALADGKLGPLRMPASLARSFLLLSTGVAIGALAMSLALIAAGGHESTPGDPNAPLEKPKQSTAPATSTRPSTTQAPKEPTAAERKAARERRARAERRRARARAQARARERARNSAATPPSGGAASPAPDAETPTP